MQLLYSGGIYCDEATLKRLLLLAEKIGFMDRPSVFFGPEGGQWGTVGVATPARQIDSSGEAVRIVACSPPGSGARGVRDILEAQELYQHYAVADITNPSFKTTVLEGLRDSERFASRFIEREGKYRGDVPGTDVVSGLVNDQALWDEDLDANVELDTSGLFDMTKSETRQSTLKVVLSDASIHVTNAMVVSNETGLSPITEDRHFAKLLSLRSSEAHYSGEVARAAPWLGMEIARAVVPDAVLEKLSVQDVLEYRQSAKDAYEAWGVEVDKLSLELEKVTDEARAGEVARTLISDVKPRLVQYRNEMKSVRDRLWGDLVKTVAKWEVPSVLAAYMTSGSITQYLIAFAGGVLAGGAGPVADYFRERQAVKRENWLSYLIELSPADGDDR